MSIHDNGHGPYRIEVNGEQVYPEMTEVKINGKTLYSFDPETGVLQVSGDQKVIELIVERVGPLPADEVVLPDIMGTSEGCHFYNVKEIQSLPDESGEFCLEIAESEASDAQDEPLPYYSGDKKICDNCSRPFVTEEILRVDTEHNLIFCPDGGCLVQYVFKTGQTIYGQSMRCQDGISLSDFSSNPGLLYAQTRIANEDIRHDRNVRMIKTVLGIAFVLLILFSVILLVVTKLR